MGTKCLGHRWRQWYVPLLVALRRSVSAQTSIIREGPDREYYLKKRGEGCKHVQAVIAFARRRTSVLWALLRDDRAFTPTPPITQTA